MTVTGKAKMALKLALVLLVVFALLVALPPQFSLRSRKDTTATTTTATTAFPKIIHFIWVSRGLGTKAQQSHKVPTKGIPQSLAENIERCRAVNPGWEVLVWDNEHVQRESSLSRLLPMLRRVQNPSWLSDILRFYLMWAYGGVHLDADFQCFRPLDLGIAHAEAAGAPWLAACEFPWIWKIPKRSSRVIGRLSSSDFFMSPAGIASCHTFASTPLASIRGSAFFKNAFQRAVDNTQGALRRFSKKKSYKPHLLSLTGPNFFTALVKAALKEGKENGMVFHSHIFFPCQLRMDKEGQPLPCDSTDRLRAEANEAVLCMHGWKGSWIPWQKQKRDQRGK